MRKSTCPFVRAAAFPAVLIVLLLMAATASVSVSAQENINGKYKVGDRVECDWKYDGDHKPGTVAEVVGEGSDLTCCRYRIKFDNDNDPLWKDGRTCPDRNTRPLGGTAAKTPAGPVNPDPKKPRTEEVKDFTYLADREIMECPPEQAKVKNGAKPNAELLKKLVRCLYERRAPAGMTGAKTVDITAFQLGAARKWRPLEDIGQGGSLGTIVYPVKASWTEKTFYESFTQQIDSTSIFNCYVTTFGEWECGLGQRIKGSEIKRTPRE